MAKAEGLVKKKEVTKAAKNLQNILHNSIFCTICLDINENLLHLDDLVLKEDWESHGQRMPMREVLKGIFGPVDILFSQYICEPCKSSATSTYSFISSSRRTAETITKYLKQLDKETTDLACIINKDWKNAMIVLEDPYVKNVTNKVEPKIQSTTTSYICDLCGKGFLKKDNLRKHLRHHENISTKDCPHCINRPCMHEKYILSFNEQILQKLKLIACLECGVVIKSTVPDLIAHVNEEHLDIKPNICKECGMKFYLEIHYKKHIETHHKNKKITREKQMKTHIETHQNTKKPFKFHMPSHLQGYLEKRVKRKSKPKQKVKRIKRTYKCSICEKVLETQQELRAHVQLHKTKPNMCVYCNKQYRSRQEYLDHVQTVEHQKNVPFNIFNHHCSDCSYATNSVAMLKTHVNRIHLSVRPFECKHCKSAYFDETQLKNHMKKHTGQVIPKVCDFCGLHLAGPTAFKKHRLLHTGERPYPCPICDTKATCATTLKMHMMRKHMEATISCPLCSKKFHTMTNARNHVKKVHWKSKEKFDYTKLKGLSPEDYEFFRDRRKALL